MKLLSRFKKSEYAKNSTILMTGTVLSMILKAITSIILADSLGAAVLGDYALYGAWYSILLVVATGRYELAIMLPKDDNDGFTIATLSAGLSVVFSVLLMVILISASFIFGFKLDWLVFLPITLAVLGVYYSINYWLNRKKCYVKLAVNRMLQGVLVLGFSFLFYFIEATRNYSLILGYLFSQTTVLVILIIYAIRDYKKYNIHIHFLRIKELAKEQINFPKLSVISGVVNNLAVKLPVLMLTFFGGKELAGQYSLMEQVLAAPITIISEAVRDVFRQKASKDYADDHECYHTYKTTFRTLAFTAIIPFALIMIGGKPIIDLLFSNGQYSMAGYFVMIMAPFFYIRFVVSPLTFMTYIAGKQAFDMKWQIAFCISSTTAFFLGFILTHNPYIMILLYGISNGIMYTISLLYTRKLAKGESLAH